MKTKEYRDWLFSVSLQKTTNQQSWQTEINFSSSNTLGLCSPQFITGRCVLSQMEVYNLQGVTSPVLVIGSYKAHKYKYRVTRPTNTGQSTEDWLSISNTTV